MRNSIFSLLCTALSLTFVTGCHKSAESPAQPVRSAGAPAQAVAIAYYPGAKLDDVSDVFDEDEHGNPTQHYTQVTLLTPDAYDKVKAFYQSRLPKNAEKLLERGEYVQWQWHEGKVQKQVELNGWRSYQHAPADFRRIKTGTLINLVQSK